MRAVRQARGRQSVNSSTDVTAEDWRQHAGCRWFGTEVFYEQDKETLGARLRRERSARAICAPCSVREMCLAHALRVGEEFGIWGGVSARERSTLRKRAVGDAAS